MTYPDFKSAIERGLRAHPDGATWEQLKTKLRLPYARPCPEWVSRLKREIGLVRKKSFGRALVWHVGKTRKATARKKLRVP